MDEKMMDLIFGAEGVEMEPEKFKVTSLQSASWCMSKASAAAGKIADAQAMVEEGRRRLDAWFDEYTAGHVATIAAMEMFLEPWVADEVADTKKKSVSLPNGTAGFRSSPESVVINDPEKIVAEAKMFGIPVQTKEYVNKTDIKKYIHEQGVVLDNAFLVPGTEKFYVKVKEGDHEIQV